MVYGPNVKSMAVALYSEGVMSNDRIASFSECCRRQCPGAVRGECVSFLPNFFPKVTGKYCASGGRAVKPQGSDDGCDSDDAERGTVLYPELQHGKSSSLSGGEG